MPIFTSIDPDNTTPMQAHNHSSSTHPHWVKISYERNEYIINLACIKSFCCEKNGRITFWLPDSSIPIIISPASNPESYEIVINYIEAATGYRV